MALKTKSASSAKVKTVGKKPAKSAKPAVTRPTKAKVAVKASKAANAEIKKAKAALKAVATPVVEAPVEKPAKASRSRKISIAANANEAVSALAQKWTSLFKKAEQIESKPYNMKAVFEEKTAIVHKVLGWGYILANRNDRLEVLFKDGIKYLISNYKA